MRGPRLRQDRATGHKGPVRGGSGEDPRLGWARWAQVARNPAGGTPESLQPAHSWVLGWHAAKHCPKAPAAAGTRVTVAPGILGGLIYSVEQDFQTECTTEPSMCIRGQRSRNLEVLPGPAQLSSNHHPETQGNQEHAPKP